jgi:hypothetical protein
MCQVTPRLRVGLTYAAPTALESRGFQPETQFAISTNPKSPARRRRHKTVHREGSRLLCRREAAAIARGSRMCRAISEAVMPSWLQRRRFRL